MVPKLTSTVNIEMCTDNIHHNIYLYNKHDVHRKKKQINRYGVYTVKQKQGDKNIITISLKWRFYSEK